MEDKFYLIWENLNFFNLNCELFWSFFLFEFQLHQVDKLSFPLMSYTPC